MVTDGRDSWMIDVPVVQYFGLTKAVSIWPQVLMLVRAVSRSWTALLELVCS